VYYFSTFELGRRQLIRTRPKLLIEMCTSRFSIFLFGWFPRRCAKLSGKFVTDRSTNLLFYTPTPGHFPIQTFPSKSSFRGDTEFEYRLFFTRGTWAASRRTNNPNGSRTIYTVPIHGPQSHIFLPSSRHNTRPYCTNNP
jgi:hypothetical protein